MARTSSINRNTLIAAGVVGLHLATLWALQTGLLQRATELIVPAEILSKFIEPPAPRNAPPPPAPARKPVPTPLPRTVTPLPQPLPEHPPATHAPLAAVAPPAASAPSTAAPATIAIAPSTAPPGPPKVEPPSSDAQYLQNPKPAYPALSKRLGEQGKVLVRVLIGVDGTAQQAEIRGSSGYERLDQAALTTVLKWRYVPGKRGGVPEAMWFNVPINFVLE